MLYKDTSLSKRRSRHLFTPSNPVNQCRKVIENTLSWLKGSHNIQMGGAWTRADVWLQNQQYVPTIIFGIDGADPTNGLFNTTNFSGASTAQLNQARNLYAVLTGRITAINGEQRLDENTDRYQYLGLSMQRAARRLRVLRCRYVESQAEPHLESRTPLRAAAALLPAQQQLLEGHG